LNHATSHAATESRPEPACDDAGAQVLLDVEVDGARYQLLRSVTPPATPEPALPPHHAGLSPREQEIVRMVALGHPNKTIAAVLEISCWTVGTYLRRIFAKLNVGSRAAMVARVMEKADLSRHPPHPTPRAPITAAPTDARPHPRPTPVEPRPTGDRAPTAEPRYLYR
jgi:DNA-binding CsgD family transcriptional regulator